MINLRCMDCMDLMAEYEDNHFDLAIVDPPYGIGQTWSKSRRDRFFRNKETTYTNGPEQKPTKEYFESLFRVSKNQIIWGWNYYSHLLPEGNNIIIWEKDRSFETTFMSEAELAWHSFSQPVRICKVVWDGARKGNETGIKKIHPFQKPIGLYQWLFHNYAKEGDKILDTHLGSGSIAIACHYMGFDLTGCEIDQDYFDAATVRIDRETAQQEFAFNA